MFRPVLSALCCALLASACAPAATVDSADSVVPGTIGIVVRPAAEGVVVGAVGGGTPAEQAGLRAGDRITHYNGVAVNTPRHFYSLLLETAPGSRARLQLVRGATVHHLEVLVEQLKTAPRAARAAAAGLT